ncbi:hypothetical protein PSTG_04225 [Puccinia striiformis f. sp. tritici PST-78]|uniref:Topoisomerase 6 subunit A/Spo11 TOPRIM domain-containing protein n=1 Tax=Puccinia striiformis f. sp. tritici PST-78 TaxID=1165861 RepID=A0A0L0VUG9_9BASI|nr:hypothetical protein PSTG_04225 [Puccinia striiformis f. sp. tritici PST-78]
MAAYADGLNPSTAIPEMELVAQITPAADVRFIFIVKKQGRGTPDLSTRQLANRLSTHEELVKRGVSTYIISDTDPYGYSITFCYKYGSWALQFYEGLTSRNAIRIGVSPMDWNEFNVHVSQIQPMDEEDYHKLKFLLDDNQISDSERSELEVFKEGQKSDLGIIFTSLDVQIAGNPQDTREKVNLEK